MASYRLELRRPLTGDLVRAQQLDDDTDEDVAIASLAACSDRYIAELWQQDAFIASMAPGSHGRVVPL